MRWHASTKNKFGCLEHVQLGRHLHIPYITILFLCLLVPPTFAERPSDQSVVEGGEAIFTCRATGQPRPVITWYKDGGCLLS